MRDFNFVQMNLKITKLLLLLEEIICGALNSPHNGRVTFQERTNGSEATYECDEGYVLRFGDSIRTCMENSQWSGNAPCCIRKSDCNSFMTSLCHVTLIMLNAPHHP